MTTQQQLASASELATKNRVRFPNENEDYRRARDALLAEEIELRRHIERVAEQRRALPPGGVVSKDYHFQNTAACSHSLHCRSPESAFVCGRIPFLHDTSQAAASEFFNKIGPDRTLTVTFQKDE